MMSQLQVHNHNALNRSPIDGHALQIEFVDTDKIPQVIGREARVKLF